MKNWEKMLQTMRARFFLKKLLSQGGTKKLKVARVVNIKLLFLWTDFIKI